MHITINTNNTTKVDAHFNTGINVIYGYSGIGKTYLFKILNDYYMNNDKLNVAYVDFNYSNKSEESIIEYCKNADIVILDNADLYITKSLISKLRKICNCIVISMKNNIFFDDNDITQFQVKYENNMIKATII
jgi:chromosomal replication initiation ATPase DnaA